MKKEVNSYIIIQCVIPRIACIPLAGDVLFCTFVWCPHKCMQTVDGCFPNPYTHKAIIWSIYMPLLVKTFRMKQKQKIYKIRKLKDTNNTDRSMMLEPHTIKNLNSFSVQVFYHQPWNDYSSSSRVLIWQYQCTKDLWSSCWSIPDFGASKLWG